MSDSADVRFTVVSRLKEALRGRDVADLAREHGITISVGGRTNKGWVGSTLDRIARTKAISAAVPDGVDFELKAIHFGQVSGDLVPKETMAITMFNPTTILAETFETSALWHKLERLILVGTVYPPERRDSASVQFVSPVDVTDPALRTEIENYWNTIRDLTLSGNISTYSSRGTSSGFIQLRTKGSGRSRSTCPITQRQFNTRAFYATKQFLRYVRGVM